MLIEQMPAMKEGVLQTPMGAIHYWHTEGGGRPWLVFLPGLTADRRLFHKQVESLYPRFSCLVWDAPAHGCSRPFSLQFSMDDLTEWLHTILEETGVAHPVLVGQSMGGYVAQAYMEQYPQDVAGFVSIDSAPLGRQYYTGAELWLLKHTKLMYSSIPWGQLQRWGTAGTAQSPYGRELMARMMGDYHKGEYCALAAHGFKLLAQAVESYHDHPLPCPALLLCGEKDGAGSCKRYDRAWAKNTGLPLVWVPGAGHNANTDAPGFVNRHIERFVQGILAADK